MIRAILKTEDRLFIIRDILIKLIYVYGEEQTIYVYKNAKNYNIEYLNFDPEATLINKGYCKCYKTTLKNCYLYALTSAYPNVPKESIIIFANRIIKRLSIPIVSLLLKMSEDEYTRIENGYIIEFDKEKISDVFNFNIKEFYFNFKDIFEEVY